MHMLDLRDGRAGEKEVEIIQTIASKGLTAGSGIVELAEAVERHRARAWSGEEGERRQKRRAAAQIAELVRALLADRIEHTLGNAGLDDVATAVVERREDPYTAAERIVASL